MNIIVGNQPKERLTPVNQTISLTKSNWDSSEHCVILSELSNKKQESSLQLIAHRPYRFIQLNFEPWIASLRKTPLKALALAFCLTLVVYPAHANSSTPHTASHTEDDSLKLPSLGHASSDTISLNQEKRLGKAWLRSLKGQISTYENPIVMAYLSQLVYSLAPSSAVVDRDFSFVIIDSKALNAFAVPGSVVGINNGLFIHALSEHEFASVMAHELAHISQRHYARRLEQQKTSTPLTFASILASVVIAAAAGSEAGIAAYASSQALAIEKQLSFSRRNEQEADRLGIVTLYESGFNPRAMPVMFERMFRQTRIQGAQLPEYLSTHPLSENRISDTRNRATQFPHRAYQESIEYHICRSIIINHFAESPEASRDYFSSLLAKGNTVSEVGAKFGLAMSLIESEPKQALSILDELAEQFPNHLSIELTRTDALYNSGKRAESLEVLRKLQQRNPNNLAVSIYLAENLIEQARYSEAQGVLVKLTKRHPENTNVWYLLAETSGKNKDIVQVHQARAEYFFLTNRLKQSTEQLELALSKSDSTPAKAVMERRLEQIKELRKNPPL